MKNKKSKGFSLVELLIVIVIIGILSVVSFVAIQRAKSKAFNERALDDLIAISNALEDYQRDHPGEYPLPAPDSNQNVLCYNIDATYTHDCETAAFRQGMIDNDLLTKRYLREVPTDPRTGSRYVYGVTNNQKYFQIAGIYEREDGTFEARTVENLIRGYELPSLIRAFDSSNFVIDKQSYLPYSPDYLVLTATLDNISGVVRVNGEVADNGLVLWEDDKIATEAGSADLYFSDGSVTHLDTDSNLELKHLKVDKNDSEGTITKILLKLNAGKIWSKVVRLAQESEFRVETNGAIAGVRGTEFGVDLDPERDNPFIFKSGEVWKMDKVDEGMGGQEDADTEDVMDIETPDPVDDPDSYNAVDAAEFGDYEEYYTDIPLHSGIQPHILSVTGGEIIVRNVNYFVEQVEPAGRNIQVSHLAAYTLTEAYSDPYFEVKILITPGTDPHSITVSTTLGEPILLRFEYRDADDNILRVSDFSAVELQITSETSLNEEDIYAEPATEEDYKPVEYILEVITDPFFPLPENPAEQPQFQLHIDVNPEPNSVSYQVTSVDPDICQTDPDDFTLIDVQSVGLCTLTVEAELEDETLMETVDVQIIPETSQLVLLFPMEADELIVIGADVMPVNFEWDAFNEPEGVTFDLYLDGVLIISDLEDHNYLYNVDKGDRTWYVIMKDSNGEIETTPESLFTITRMESGGAEFTITEYGNVNNTPDDVGNMVVYTDKVTLNLNVDFSDTSGNVNYNWSGSLPLTNNTEASTSSEELSFLDDNAPLSYSVILEVVYSDGNVVDSVQTVTLIYEPAVCGNGVTEDTEVCDEGADNSDAYGSLCRTDCSGPGPHCGDSIIQENDGEECDDGNTADGDGCSLSCKIEQQTFEEICVGPADDLNRTNVTGGYRNTQMNTYYEVNEPGGPDECWVLGAEGQVCDDGAVGACRDIGLICAGGDWNDIDEVACNAITGGAPQTNADFGFAPYYYTQYNKCYERLDIFTYVDLNTVCNTIPDAGKQRVCKCE